LALQIPYADILSPLIYFVATLVATWIVATLLGALLGRVMRTSNPLVATQAKRFSYAFVWFAGILLAVEQLGLRIDLLVVIVALLGGALILANKDTLQNAAAKYFSDVYVPFKVGDSIAVQGHAGTVIEVNPMTTVLLTPDDKLVAVPNSIFMRDVMVNATPQAWKEVVIPIAVSGDVDLAEFERAIYKSCSRIRLHLDERFPPVLSVKSRGPQSSELLLTLMIKAPEKKDAVVLEMNTKIAEILDRLSKGKPER
jgi:small conductance mechanosensitive channel